MKLQISLTHVYVVGEKIHAYHASETIQPIKTQWAVSRNSAGFIDDLTFESAEVACMQTDITGLLDQADIDALHQATTESDTFPNNEYQL